MQGLRRITNPVFRAQILIAVMDPTRQVHPTINSAIVEWLDKGCSMNSIANACLGDGPPVKTNLTREQQIPEMMARLKAVMDDVVKQ